MHAKWDEIIFMKKYKSTFNRSIIHNFHCCVFPRYLWSAKNIHIEPSHAINKKKMFLIYLSGKKWSFSSRNFKTILHASHKFRSSVSEKFHFVAPLRCHVYMQRNTFRHWNLTHSSLLLIESRKKSRKSFSSENWKFLSVIFSSLSRKIIFMHLSKRLF